MKKFLTAILLMFILPLCAQAEQKVDNIALLTRQGFFNKPQPSRLSPKDEIKRFFKLHTEYSNSYKIDELKTLYSDKYVNSDGFNKEVYFKLVKSTFETYPDIKYSCKIKKITFTSKDDAIVEVDEHAVGTSSLQSKLVPDFGSIENVSSCVYYLKKTRGNWQIASDSIYLEKTYLNYGSAKYIPADLFAPSQTEAGKPYVIGLKVLPPRNGEVVISLGHEKITYPQKNTEGVYRKLPESNLLERIVNANDDNVNEYANAFYVVMHPEFKDNDILEMRVSGVGFAMSRVNVIPKNKYIEVKNEKDK